MTTENLKLKIVQDDDPGSPRDWDNLGRMLCWHNRYTLGDEQPKRDPQEILAELPKGSVVLPLYLYDHGGISMKAGEAGNPFSDMFDSGQIGFIYATPERICKEYSCKRISKAIREKVIACLKGEVETYDMFLQGDVWGFVLETVSTCDKGHTHAEHIDSCFGFFGNDKDGIAEHLPEEAKPLLDEAWDHRGT